MTAWDHLVAELREGAGTFLTAWWRTLLAAQALMLLVGLAVVLPDGELDGLQKLLAMVLLLPLYGLVKGALVGVPVAGLAVLHRLIGWSIVVPVLATLAGVGLAGWLGGPLVAAAMAKLGAALGARAQELSAMPVARVGHPVVLLILIPVLVLHFGSAPGVLAALAWLALVLVLVVGGGGALGLGASLPVVVWAALGRLRDRAAARAPGEVPAGPG